MYEYKGLVLSFMCNFMSLTQILYHLIGGVVVAMLVLAKGTARIVRLRVAGFWFRVGVRVRVRAKINLGKG